MNKRLIVQLRGGLGNQMFQYATARALAMRNKSELILDTWTGFARDYQYKRQYELSSFPLHARIANQIERIPFWLDRIRGKVRMQKQGTVIHHCYGDSINETKFEYLPEVAEYGITRHTWLTGSWQTALYFQNYKSTIEQELKPPLPIKPHYGELGKKMMSVRSVAIGVRLYEESKNPSAHAADGRMKTVKDLNNAVQRLSELDTDFHFFIFCTSRSSMLEQLKLPGKVTYVTHEDGFQGTVESLWLLTQCRHHIITNSSFYWWGAWLSSLHYPFGTSEVFAADNFLNKHSIPSGWHLF